jgi:hypothetical protein
MFFCCCSPCLDELYVERKEEQLTQMPVEYIRVETFFYPPTLSRPPSTEALHLFSKKMYFKENHANFQDDDNYRELILRTGVIYSITGKRSGEIRIQ